MFISRRVSIFLTVVAFFNSATLLAKVGIEQLEREISQRLDKVEQFSAIKKIAGELGLKHVYLFGGTASAWSHYVYQDLMREDGDNSYPKSRFNYDYTEIFRSNQDMDILVDGTPEQAEKLEAFLQSKFKFFQGSKSVFEVRLKNIARGDKDAIVDPNFFNQNTDSHSTGLVTIVGDHNEEIVQDTKEPTVKVPQFLKDVYEHKLHFYYNREKHLTTKRFKEGKNPELFAAVRYLIKLFQFELKADDESWKNIEHVIQEFDPKSAERADSYVKYWLEKNGPKLFQNAVNMEYAWNTLEKLGLRQKLIELSDPKTMHSLAWWMNKEPLRSSEVGTGSGKTVRELGYDIVAHETDSFSAFESITKSKSGKPNVFISRDHAIIKGETAAYGDGFYTRVGREGARGTGITIRFHINPEAREGTDFKIKDDYIIFINRNAFTVIHEDVALPPFEFLEKLARGEIVFDTSDQGVLYNVKRRLTVAASSITPREKVKLRAMLRTSKSKEYFTSLILIAPEVIELKKPELFFELLKETKLPIEHEGVLEILEKMAKVNRFKQAQLYQLIANGSIRSSLSTELLKKKLYPIFDITSAAPLNLIADEVHLLNKTIVKNITSTTNTAVELLFHDLIENSPATINHEVFFAFLVKRGQTFELSPIEKLEELKSKIPNLMKALTKEEEIAIASLVERGVDETNYAPYVNVQLIREWFSHDLYRKFPQETNKLLGMLSKYMSTISCHNKAMLSLFKSNFTKVHPEILARYISDLLKSRMGLNSKKYILSDLYEQVIVNKRYIDSPDIFIAQMNNFEWGDVKLPWDRKILTAEILAPRPVSTGKVTVYKNLQEFLDATKPKSGLLKALQTTPVPPVTPSTTCTNEMENFL